MASAYALPNAAPAGDHQHAHSHSFSGQYLTPEKKAANTYLNSNGSAVRKAVSHNALYTHAEASREMSPLPSPPAIEKFPVFELNSAAMEHNHLAHGHTPSRSWSPMKSRQRGDSDLGDARYRAGSRPMSNGSSTVLSSWLSLPEALTSLLVPLPYMLASATFSSMATRMAGDFPPMAIYEQVDRASQLGPNGRSSGLLETCALVSGTLLVVGLGGKIRLSGQTLDRRKNMANPHSQSLLSLAAMQSILLRCLSLALPLYASLQLGGARVGLTLLVALAVGMTSGTTRSIESLKAVWSSQVASTGVILIGFIFDEAGLTIFNSLTNVMLGYLALALSAIVFPFPLEGAIERYNAVTDSRPPFRSGRAASVSSFSLTRSADDINMTLAAGTLLAICTALAAFLTSSTTNISTSTFVLAIVTIAAMSTSIILSAPRSLNSPSKAGLALGCLTTASCSFLFSPSLWPGTICNGGLSALAFLGVLYDTNTAPAHDHMQHPHDHHDHAHHRHVPTQTPRHAETTYSVLTKFVMARCEPGSLVYTILSEKDSRRIAYFTILNFGFMLVQGAYGYLSGSLGLLSDTVHMFFDCLGLVVGLGAAVASKWPTSPEKPYGWGKLNTLAGFGNGVFLMLVSVEFVWEAIEGMLEKRELRHVQELLVVSTLGLLVNMVGLFAFGHAHAGHDHGHSHSHDHGHSQSHSHVGHDHSHSNGHAHSRDCSHDHAHNHQKQPESHGGHDHHNDNMHGIFLHVAADAGGSLAVIISTALTLWNPWYLWDPLATIIIAVLIFAAAVPLVTSSGQKLLLVVPEDLEYSIKTTLQGLGELRGVIGYAAPRFWLDDKEDAGDVHGHHHHDHSHSSHSGKQRVQGVIHIIAAPFADLEDVRERVEEFTVERNMNLVIHVEQEADGDCWCGGTGSKAA